jgi:hypothetical protein
MKGATRYELHFHTVLRGLGGIWKDMDDFSEGLRFLATDTKTPGDTMDRSPL